MPLNFRRSLRLVACTTLVFMMSSVGVATAQTTMQTGGGLLMIKADMPESARVGEQFTYTVEVTNASDQTVLHDIKLKQRRAKGFQIESVSVNGKQEDTKQSDESSSSQDQKSQKQQSDSGSSNQDQGNQSQSSDKVMKIDTLKPGERREFTIQASGDEEGELRSCLEVVSYTPAICLTSQIVKPELELTKMAPKKANRCNVIELNYKVKNAGSGDVGKFEITDSLGDGLATIDGESELSFPVDGLAAGETREFVARVYARKSGTFRSRAVAKADGSELKSRSKETATEVIAADLMVQVDGAERVYADDLVTFTATIANTGNAAAESVNVTVEWPAKANLADMSDYKTQQHQGNNAQGGQSGEPTPASDNQTADSQKSDSRDNNKMEMQTESFVIDRLEAGQAAEFTYAIRTDNLDKVATKVRARHVCTVDAAEDQEKSTAKTTATSMATAEVVRLPALQLAVVDAEDPVKQDGNVEYIIQVWNEGDAPDQNVQLVAMLPKNLKFKSADGPTDSQSEGNEIKFKPIKTMEPGERVEYTVTAEPTGTGNVRFEASLTSKMLQNKVTGEEPTRLFASQKK
ncbi:COG1361 family protein [Rhodopirellula sallentina]|uniref:DUF11 domain-containing protein n=1 Tax=Rhodopirellula sallentina TaxID=1263869 RepID=UPI0006948AF8|nr:DUF11 domain-containing protein [Rhodopirellula sallentina]